MRRRERPRRGPGRGALGSATVWVLACVVVIVTVAAAAASVGAAVLSRHRAQAAADLAALAAAGMAAGYSDGPCRLARDVARSNGGRLVGCRLDGMVADVVVEVTLPGWLPAVGSARARSRAGPSAPDDSAGS